MNRRRVAAISAVGTVGALALALLPALAPLLRPGLPATDDGLLHLYRLVAQDEVIRATGAPSRWLPDLAFGYGAPIFNYYAPLAYAPALAGALLGLGYVGGLKLAFGLPLVLSAATTFLLVRALFGAAAGFAAGLVYAYLPYLLIDAYVRGALAESAAFAWLPLACWCLVRLRADPRPGRTVGAALAVGGLVLTHNIVALFALPTLLALAASLWRPGDGVPTGARRYALHVGLAFALGMGLGAWYWLPAIWEKELVQTDQALIAPDRLARYFLQAWPPIQLGLAYDYAGLGAEDWAEVRLGLVQAGVLAAGAVAAARTRGPARRVCLWAVGVAIAALALQGRYAAPLFEVVPLAGYIQFPWRLLALVGLATAILAGALVHTAPPRAGARPLAALALAAVSGYAGVAGLAPRAALADDRHLAASGALPSELMDLGLATTWFGELVPRTVPHPGHDVLRRAILYRDGLAPAPPERSALAVEVRSWSPTAIRAAVFAERPDALLVHQFFFPGWSATVDGAPAPVRPGGGLGVLAVDVPAGRHDVELRFGWTMPRLTGLALSGLALGGLAALGVLAWRPARHGRRPVSAPARAGIALLAVLLAGGAAVAGRGGDGAAAASADAASGTPAAVDERLTLAGWSLDPARLASDGALDATLYWLSLGEQAAEYDVRLRVVGADGRAHDAWWEHGPTRRAWDRGELVRTRTEVRLPGDFPVGPARASVVVERRDGRAGPPVAEIDLGALDVPPRRARPDGPRFERTPEQDPLEALRLVSYDVRAAEPVGRALAAALAPRAPEAAPDGAAPSLAVRPGDALDVRLDWEVRLLPFRDVIATVELRARRGGLATEPSPVGDWFHPFLAWQVGDRIAQQVRLAVPPEQAPGAYDLVLRAASRDRSWAPLDRPADRSDAEDDEGRVQLGTVVVERP